ncbi:MAG TPA: adenylyltransferase/cytidyltransferase family protein [Nostocaceae cyanobacterium]|nr:adenylyltransferase/cytidyltransferase family protein [Nostocaceae cyanobacterium]
MQEQKKKTIVITSMYANPLHPGHVECCELAKQLGDELWVIVNNDQQAELKRGVPSFQDQDYRLRIVQALKPVDKVILSIDTDPSVCATLTNIFSQLKADSSVEKIIFAKGGDRFAYEIPERKICDEYGVTIIDGLGAKTYNSSDYIKK